jgi:large exoprotein involved in heme utilization and adhesion
VTTGRGGLPENPMQAVQSAAVWQDRRMLAVGSPGKAVATESRREIERSTGVPLAEATDWGRGANGQVELVARSAGGAQSGFQVSCATVK